MVVLQLDGQQVIDIGEEFPGAAEGDLFCREMFCRLANCGRALPSSSCSALVWRDSSHSTSPLKASGGDVADLVAAEDQDLQLAEAAEAVSGREVMWLS